LRRLYITAHDKSSIFTLEEILRAFSKAERGEIVNAFTFSGKKLHFTVD